MTKQQSKIVTTNQNGIHKDLEKIIKRYSLNYQRPISDFSYTTMKRIFEFTKGKRVIFDFGCGIGQSTYILSQLNPEKVIVGIDKSLSRIERKNHFKENQNKNVLIVRGELLDLIYLIHSEINDNKLKVEKVYFLYPNPYPKKLHVKRRFHGNPIAPFIFALPCPIILRSNWKLYLEEFQFVAKLFNRSQSHLIELSQIDNMTPFEKKYSESNQKLFELVVH